MKTVLFDMDGVLIDVRRSYLVVIQKTIAHFSLQNISFRDIARYRNLGGLNNDWDLCQAILKDRGFQLDKKEIVSVFQTLYLGANFDGLITQETSFIETRILSHLCPTYAIGIVTGRPRIEAEFTLKRLGLWPFFPVCITADDVAPGKGKPHPQGLILAMKKSGTAQGYYVGDTVDDMQAALAAGLKPIGVAAIAQDRVQQTEVLLQQGAAWILDDVNKIMEVLL